uniref:Aldehyde dehydrogenase domain-containing protein n=1 Tax=Ditylenchus dipsaci TaxID=166011 RepID=A0A915DTR7_9BILA
MVKLKPIRNYSGAGADEKFCIPNDLLSALHFVNGARVNLKSQRKFNVFEPRNGEHLTEIHSASASQVDEVIDLSQKAQTSWSSTPWVERRQILQRTADLIRKHSNEISVWEVRDNGKSITEAKADVLSCADTFEYFSGVDLSGEHMPYDEQAKRFAYTRREPLGVVGAIGAWNYPIQTATWKIAPAIACGNSVVYKPSPLAPVSSILLAQLLQCAGLPDGVVNIVQGESETGTALCESAIVRKVSFTGSVATGQAIAKNCAQWAVKPVTLELGGKSSCIMLQDCDIEMAVNGALIANFFSQGQVCSNASKILVHQSILEEFTTKLLLKTEELRIGDPLNESTHIGACISLNHLQKVQNYIRGAVEEGAKVLYGGERVVVEALEKGYFLEEVFGAVLLIIPFETEQEALQKANDTEFGLAAGIFTNDLNKAHNFAAQLQAGTVYINTFNDTCEWLAVSQTNTHTV